MLNLVARWKVTGEILTGCAFSFNDIAWTESEDNSRGVIAGALENGSLDLWDADKLLNGARFVGFFLMLRRLFAKLTHGIQFK